MKSVYESSLVSFYFNSIFRKFEVFLPTRLSVWLKIIFFISLKSTKSLRKLKFLRYVTFWSRGSCDIQFHKYVIQRGFLFIILLTQYPEWSDKSVYESSLVSFYFNSIFRKFETLRIILSHWLINCKTLKSKHIITTSVNSDCNLKRCVLTFISSTRHQINNLMILNRIS
jgi:hypothetical protein